MKNTKSICFCSSEMKAYHLTNKKKEKVFQKYNAERVLATSFCYMVYDKFYKKKNI